MDLPVHIQHELVSVKGYFFDDVLFPHITLCSHFSKLFSVHARLANRKTVSLSWLPYGEAWDCIKVVVVRCEIG